MCRHPSDQREVENGAVGESGQPLGWGLGCSRSSEQQRQVRPRPIELEPERHGFPGPSSFSGCLRKGVLVPRCLKRSGRPLSV